MKKREERESEWKKLRIGIGSDIHQLKTGRKLILGGVEILHDKGLLGHSDGDVLLHAIMDSILGAAESGDIGRFFREDPKEYADISSLILLERVCRTIRKTHQIINIDSIIVCEKPKIQPYFAAIRESIEKIVKAPVHIKATTTDRMNAEGQGLCISAQAVSLLLCQ